MDEWEKQIDRQTDGWVDEWMDEQEKQIDRQTDGWMDEWSYFFLQLFLSFF